MKKALVVLAAMLLMVALAACGGGNGNPASDFEYRATTGGVEITKYIGTSIRVRIPDRIEGEPVVKIGGAAFSGSGIMEISMPDTVEEIGNRAFANNRGLTSITFPDGLKRIGTEAFLDCTGLTSVTFPNNVQNLTIGSDAFFGCTGLSIDDFPSGFDIQLESFDPTWAPAR